MAETALALLSRRQEDVESGDNFNTIPGLRKAERMSFQAAYAFAVAGDKDLADNKDDLKFAARMAQSFATSVLLDRGATEVLSADQIAAIQFYTQESPFYSILNVRLRDRDRVPLIPFLPFIKLLLSGLYTLPRHSVTVFRGVKKNLKEIYLPNKPKVWWSFSSTTRALQVLESENFVGKKGDRTMFHIHTTAAIDIGPYSAFPNEQELVRLGCCVWLLEGEKCIFE